MSGGGGSLWFCQGGGGIISLSMFFGQNMTSGG